MHVLEKALVGHHRYQPLRYLTRGSFGSVVLALDRETGMKVALKFLRRTQAVTSGLIEAEVLIHMQLKHPHIVRLVEVFLTDDYFVMVLEYAPGGDLSKYIRSKQGIPEQDARWIIQQVAFGLEYCHRMSVASHDIKLENVLLMEPYSPDNTRPICKLSDFGLSINSGSSHDGIVGTPLYMAPEVVARRRGEGYDAKKADVWACGVMLHTMLTGSFPFEGSWDRAPGSPTAYTKALLLNIVSAKYVPPEGLSPGCRELLSGMLESDPAKRLSAREVLLHPWCCQGVNPSAMLTCNDHFYEQCQANPPSPELIQDIHDILEEACSLPPHLPSPTVRHRAQVAGSSQGSSSGTDSDPGVLEGERKPKKPSWLTRLRRAASGEPSMTNGES